MIKPNLRKMDASQAHRAGYDTEKAAVGYLPPSHISVIARCVFLIGDELTASKTREVGRAL